MNKKEMLFGIGMKYDAMEHSLEENAEILGRPLAEQIEHLKGLPDSARVAVVTKIDRATGIVTIESIDSDQESGG